MIGGQRGPRWGGAGSNGTGGGGSNQGAMRINDGNYVPSSSQRGITEIGAMDLGSRRSGRFAAGGGASSQASRDTFQGQRGRSMPGGGGVQG